MKQLVSSWVASQHGYQIPLPQAIRELSEATGIKTNHSRLSEWRKGKYTPSQPVISQLLYDMLPWGLQKAGIKATDAQLAALEDLIWEVKVIDGRRQIELT